MMQKRNQTKLYLKNFMKRYPHSTTNLYHQSMTRH